MKKLNGFLFFALVLGACEDPVIPPEYTVKFPVLPTAWQELLGPAHWRLSWLNPQGLPQFLETNGTGTTSIAAVLEWATPVLAFPYWPRRGIHPGEMRPSGGILPFDAAGSALQLSWQGGVEAWFYRKLSEARTAAGNADTGNVDEAALNKRRPEYFDWPRFHSLMDSDVISEAVRDDPWQVDWQDVAVRTVKSGFDRRRIKVQQGEELLVPGDAGGPTPAGPFAGPSPFAQPLAPEPGTGFRFRVTARPDTYVSAGGILRVSRKTWVYYPL
ncbi:hypothetical protein AGMMS49942_11290 [Spirochaetia bacterium]|nr:hypothetical protein AGMMS49942_11290 [Spirochaetia bacterium]